MRTFLKRPELKYEGLIAFAPFEVALPKEVIKQVEVQIKYAGYIKKAAEKVDKLKKMEEKRIPANIDYDAINGIANEAKQNLKKIQPETIAQASRISGVNPSRHFRFDGLRDPRENRQSFRIGSRGCLLSR